MKQFLFLGLVLCLARPVSAQTEAIEKKALLQLYESGKITLDQYQNKGKQLLGMINSEGGFPKLPFDTSSGSFSFRYVCKVPGMTKKQIMARIKECAALSYQKLDAVNEYEDVEAGKFITEGWFPVVFDNSRAGLFGSTLFFERQADCYHSFVFTVKDGAFKLEVKNLMYRFKFGGYNYLTGTFSTVYYDEKYLDSMFPLANQPEKSWAGILNLVRETELSLERLSDIYKKHVTNFEEDYRF